MLTCWLPAVRQRAFVAWRGRRCLLIESAGPLTELNFTELRAALTWAHFDDIRLVRRIPVDRRYQAKIDYVRLAKLLR